jgi:hypothetical protein
VKENLKLHTLYHMHQISSSGPSTQFPSVVLGDADAEYIKTELTYNFMWSLI